MKGEVGEAIDFSNLVLLRFHTPFLNFGPKLLASQFVWISYSQSNLSVFTQRTFKGCRCALGSKGAYGMGGFPEKKCKIWPKRLLLASYQGKKVNQAGPGNAPQRQGNGV